MTRRSYRLTIEGELGELAREVFEGASVRTERGNTVVVVRDQAELLGLMQRDLGPRPHADQRVTDRRAGAPQRPDAPFAITWVNRPAPPPRWMRSA